MESTEINHCFQEISVVGMVSDRKVIRWLKNKVINTVAQV